MWNGMGKCLGRWASPEFWNCTPEQVQNPDKLVEHLEEVCCHPRNSRQTQITAMCWGLAQAYRALFNTIQCSKWKGGGKQSDRHQLCSCSNRHYGRRCPPQPTLWLLLPQLLQLLQLRQQAPHLSQKTNPCW